jgi:hypothetical protein
MVSGQYMTIDELLVIEEIRNLRYGYSAFLDSHDLDALLGLFTNDAVCEFGADFGLWRGKEEIRQGYVAAMKDIGTTFDAMHVVTNPWIQVTGPDTAHGRWYLLDLLTRQKPVTGLATRGGHDNPLLYVGVYEDDYRKVAGAWRICYTKLHFLWPDRSFSGLRHPRLA